MVAEKVTWEVSPVRSKAHKLFFFHEYPHLRKLWSSHWSSSFKKITLTLKIKRFYRKIWIAIYFKKMFIFAIPIEITQLSSQC